MTTCVLFVCSAFPTFTFISQSHIENHYSQHFVNYSCFTLWQGGFQERIPHFRKISFPHSSTFTNVDEISTILRWEMFTLMVAGSAMFLSRSRRSRVRRGKLSHKPTTTRSMSLKQGNYISLTVQLLSNHLPTLLLKSILENIFDVLLLVHLYLLQSVKCSVSSHILFVCPNSISLITVEIINQPPISKVLYSYKSFILRMGGVVWPICEHLFWSSKILNIRLLKTVLEMQGFRLVTLALSELLNV